MGGLTFVREHQRLCVMGLEFPRDHRQLAPKLWGHVLFLLLGNARAQRSDPLRSRHSQRDGFRKNGRQGCAYLLTLLSQRVLEGLFADHLTGLFLLGLLAAAAGHTWGLPKEFATSATPSLPVLSLRAGYPSAYVTKEDRGPVVFAEVQL